VQSVNSLGSADRSHNAQISGAALPRPTEFAARSILRIYFLRTISFNLTVRERSYVNFQDDIFLFRARQTELDNVQLNPFRLYV
jgi:hypothetical protein